MNQLNFFQFFFILKIKDITRPSEECLTTIQEIVGSSITIGV